MSAFQGLVFAMTIPNFTPGELCVFGKKRKTVLRPKNAERAGDAKFWFTWQKASIFP